MELATHTYFSLIWLLPGLGTGILSLTMLVVASQMLRTGRGSPNAIAAARTVRISAGIVAALSMTLVLKALGIL